MKVENGIFIPRRANYILKETIIQLQKERKIKDESSKEMEFPRKKVINSPIYNYFSNANNLPPENNLNCQNTEILKVKIKVGPNQDIIFSVRRFDDIFKSFWNLCVTKNIPPHYFKPLLRQMIIAMNRIFLLYNTQLTWNDHIRINQIKSIYLARHQLKN